MMSTSSLSPEQLQVEQLIDQGQSVLFTGPAGTGKSFLIQHLIQKYGSSQGTAITAMTGTAAVPIKGMTLHSFAGIRLGELNAQDLLSRVWGNRLAMKRWRECTKLIVDEISMQDASLFDKLEFIARQVRHSNQPFGGIQLILSGDYCQLPCVAEKGQTVQFCFESTQWSKCIPNVVLLKQVFRQTDQSFVQCLSEIRVGQVSLKTKQLMQQCENRQFDISDGIEPTILYTTRNDVKLENLQRLNALPSLQEQVYTSYDEGEPSYVDIMKRNCPVPQDLTLKVGAQVMLLKNLDTTGGLVNGSRGVVTRFCNELDIDEKNWKQINVNQCWPEVRFVSGRTALLKPETWDTEIGGIRVSRRAQVPLMLAWAVTIHKAQGLTLDRCVTNLNNVFEYGQAYVALSRVRTLEGLKLLAPFDPKVVRAHPKALAFYNQLNQQQSNGPSNHGPTNQQINGQLNQQPSLQSNGQLNQLPNYHINNGSLNQICQQSTSQPTGHSTYPNAHNSQPIQQPNGATNQHANVQSNDQRVSKRIHETTEMDNQPSQKLMCIRNNHDDQVTSRARNELEHRLYASIATVDSNGCPWNAPVYFALDSDRLVNDGSIALFWISESSSQHSINIREHKSDTFVVVYDSTISHGNGFGVYLQGKTKEMDQISDIEYADKVLRTKLHIPVGRDATYYLPPNPRRIYWFHATKLWTNQVVQENGQAVDRRLELLL